MTLVIEGKTRCPICNLVHRSVDDLIGFPAFKPDAALKADVFDLINDTAVHRSCLREHPDIIEAAIANPEIENYFKTHLSEFLLEK